MIRRNIFVVFSIILALFMASCDVGLGSAVDTEPPTLTIDYPQSGSIIRDSFIVAGSCKDDVGVSEVKVIVKTLGGNPVTVGEYEATVDNETESWQIELNHQTPARSSYNGWDYPDGNYAIDVTAYDDSGRVSGTSSISIIVDNTAPLMILKTPGNANIAAPTEYGTTVKIAGTIVDDNSVKYLNMGFLAKGTDMATYDFENPENLIASWTLSNINTAGGTEEVFAKLDGSADEDARYRAVYRTSDLDANGNIYYNLLFTVTDDAKEYKDPKETVNNTLGNSTNSFFFSDDVTSVWSSESKGTTFKTVQKVINGTSTDVSDELKEEILTKYVNAAKQYAACLINKDANPKYSVLGYSVDEDKISIEQKNNMPSAQAGGTISIQSVMGRNANYILPKTIHVIQVGPFTEDANLKNAVKSVYSNISDVVESTVGVDTDNNTNITVLRQASGTINIDGKVFNWRELGIDSSETEERDKKNNSSSCESYTYSVKVAADTKPGSIYLIAAIGDDEQSGKLTNDGYYVFKGSTSDIPPTVLWESDLDNGKNGVKDRGYVKDYSKLKFGGKYTSNVELEEEYCTYTVVITGENGTANPVSADFAGLVTIDKDNKLWSIDLSKNADKFAFGTEKEYLYDITVSLKNSAGTGTNNHKVHIDTKKPVVNITSISPTTSKSYSISGGGTVERTAVNGKIKYQGNVDDTALMNVECEVSYATDGEVLFKKSLGKTYTVNDEINTRLKYALDGTVSDNGKGIKDESTFIIKLIATDEAGNIGTYDSSSFNKNDPLYIDQVTDIPGLEPNNFTLITDKTKVKDNDNVFDAAGNKTLLATITDDDLLQAVKVEFYKEDKVSKFGSATEIKNLNQSSYALKQVLPATDGIYWVKIYGKDNDGHTTAYKSLNNGFFIAVDTDKPTITESAVNEEKTRYVKKNGALSFSGTATDKWEVISAYAKIENLKDSSKNKDVKLTVDADGNWDYTFNAANFENEAASYKITFEVTDRAGKTNQVIRNITIDVKEPAISAFDINATTSYEKTIYANKQYVRKNSSGTIIGYDVDLATDKNDVNYWYNQSQLPIRVVATDEGSEVSSVEWSTNYDAAKKTGNWSSLVKGTSEWTGTATCNKQGENTISIKVVDAAGNETISSKKVNVDTETPDGIDEKYINDGTADTVYVKTNDSVKISVKASDTGTVNSGIGMVYYSYESNTYYAQYKNDYWELTIPWATISAYQKSRNTVKLTVVDKVGLETKESVVNIQKDTTAPTSTIKPLIDADDSLTGLQVNGTITVSGSAKDNTVLKSVTLEYQKKGTTDWVSLGTLSTADGKSESDIANWSFDVDTTALATTGNVEYKLRAIVTDAAGNSGSKTNESETTENEITVFVNQDSDRPVMHLTNLEIGTESSTDTLYLHNSTLSGYTSDDDGVKEVWYSINDGTYAKATLKVGNAWEINVSDEGANTIKFKVFDTVNKDAFISGATKKPKITDGKNTYSTNNCDLKFNLVLKDPEVTNTQFSVYNSETKNWSSYSSSLRKVGGIYTKFKMKIDAQSANEINPDKITVTLNNGTAVKFTCAASAYASFNPVAKNTWESGEIAVGTAETPTIQSLNYDVYDKAGKHTAKAMNVTVDNTKPVVTISKPSLLIGSEETIRGGLNETADLYWTVSKKDDNDPSTKWTKFQEEDIGTNWFLYFDGGTDTDHTNKFADYLTEDFLKITTKKDIKDNVYQTETELLVWIKAVDECGNTTIVNQTVKVDPQGERPAVALSYPANVLKEGSTTEYEAPKLSGTIPLSGIATDNNGAKYAWIQVASSDSGFTKDDLKKLNDAGYSLGQISKNASKSKSEIQSVISANTNIEDYGIMVPVNGQAWNLSINVNKEFNPTSGTATLYLTIYATDQDGEGASAVIHRSTAITQQVVIDAQSPYVERTSLQMVQYYKSGNSGEVCTDGTVSSGTVANAQAYSAGMSISGIWFLKGKFVDDDSGLKSISYNNTTVVNSAGSEVAVNSRTDGAYFTKSARVVKGKTLYDYNFQIPLGSKTSGKVGTSTATYRIVENTDTALWDENSFSVIYDNMAPVIKTNKNDSVFVKFDDKVENSNGFYSFGSVASEEDAVEGNETIAQSGVTRVAFYFTRDLEYNLYAKSATTYNKHSSTATKTRDLFDVMIYNSGNEANDVASGNTIIDYETLTLSEGIYWRGISGTVSGNTFTYTVEDPNVHEKGLVKINGVIYLIDSKNGKVLTLKGSSSDAKPGDGTVTAYVALCNVIDNSGEKNTGKIASNPSNTYGYGYYPARASDDGDLITETFTKQGTDWIFDASVNSKNLPDGPITVHIIAFDGAGNHSEYSYSGVVSNNAPRIAGMMIGTDEDGNGEVSDNEFIKTYSGKYTLGYDSSDNIITEVTFPTQNEASGTPKALLTVKGKTVMKPELVGGNGNLSYTYAVYNHDTGLTWNETAERTVATPVVIASGTNDQVATLSKNIELNVKDFIGTTNNQDKKLINDGNNKKFSFSFGDSTPGTTISDGISNNASIDVIMNVSIRETEAAKTWIKPFYWKDKNDNSLFLESTKNGHIEISKDISGDDKQPKVSGAVKLEGIAQDNALLSSITVSLNKAFGSAAANSTLTLGTYVPSTATWTTSGLTKTETDDGIVYSIPAAGWASEISKATYGDLLDAGITLTTEDTAALAEGTKTRDSLVAYNSQDYGHVVHWTMYIDTSKITGVAANDVTVTAKATDRGSPKWNSTANAPVYTANTAVVTNATVTQSGGDAGTGSLSGTYTMDIVPYITKVYTAMAALQKKEVKWSTTSRSSNGHYPVRVVTKDADGGDGSSETIKIYGFNLGNDTTKATYTPAGGSATQLTKASDVYGEYVSIAASTLKASATKASGAFALKVNGVSTINNTNNNNAKGSATAALNTENYSTYAYNRLPNGDNNNLLTDDVYFDVWEFNSAAAIPISGKIEQPVMKIRPTDGKIGFAFVNGPLYFSMGGSESEEDYSYQYWTASYDFFTSVGFAYDKLGNSYGVAAGGDINSASADKFVFLTSKWGVAFNGTGDNRHDSTYKNPNNLRMESIGHKVNNVPTFDKQRIKSPSFATAVHDGTTNLYLAYYDAMNAEIRFKYGQPGDSKGDFGNSFKDYEKNAIYNYQRGTVSMIAGSETGRNAGEYLSLGVVSKQEKTASGKTDDDVVVCIWYADRTLWYSYNDTPTTDRANTNDGSGWSTAVRVFADDSDYSEAGEYCKLTVDANGGIHIAAYDPVNLDLVYSYLPAKKGGKPSKTGDFVSCIVDGNGVVGSNLTLDVAISNSKIVPYIGYYSTSSIRPKMAYYVGESTETTTVLGFTNDTTSILAGTEDDEFTGKWECSIVPTASTVEMQSNQHNDIGIGVWKTSAGVLTAPNVSGKNSSTSNTVNSYDSDSYGQVYGNGTSNAVLGYAIKHGASSDNIETAQMK